MSKQHLTSPKQVAEKHPELTEQRQAKLRMRGAICPYVRIGKAIFYVNWDDWIAKQVRKHTRDHVTA